MVLDEAHNIKNFRSQRWQTLLTFKTRARLLLTGTPPEQLDRVVVLLFFLMPSESTETGIGGFADLKNSLIGFEGLWSKFLSMAEIRWTRKSRLSPNFTRSCVHIFFAV
jgi:hypothetical protein